MCFVVLLYKELISKRTSLNMKTISNKNVINNKNVIYDYFKKNDDEKNRNLHRWCLSNKNKTKREINYPW